jgi:predicted nucleotidyltransferase
MENLLAFLNKNKDSRKIFGKSELKIIEKQLLGINLKQSEKNRLSRDIRKKFQFIKEISRFSEEFELKKSALILEFIKDAKEEILNDILSKKIKEITIYGSFVENNLNYRSDIDIAVKFLDINLKEATLFRKRILGKLNSKIDLQVYNILQDKIKKEIDKNGKVIYNKDENKR